MHSTSLNNKKKNHTIKVVVGFIAVAILFTIYYLTTSLWFFHGLVSTQHNDYIIGISDTSPVKQITPLIERYVLPQDVTTVTKLLTRYAIGTSGDTVVIAGLPKLRNQLRVSQELLDKGWQVKRVGWYIYAENQTSKLQTKLPMANGYRQIISQIRNNSTPVNPLVIAQVRKKSLPLVNQPSTAVAYWRNGQLNIDATLNSFDIESIEMSRKEEVHSDKELYIAIQSAVLNSAPTETLIEWEKSLSGSLSFKNTTPNILQDLRGADQIVINKKGSDVAITAIGRPESTHAKVEGWLLAEAAYDTPVKKAFRLPDGTIGHEYVPEQMADVTIGGARGCQSFLSHEQTLWICVHEGHTTLTTNKDLSLTQPPEKGTWNITLPVENIGTIVAVGTEHSAHIKIK